MTSQCYLPLRRGKPLDEIREKIDRCLAGPAEIDLGVLLVSSRADASEPGAVLALLLEWRWRVTRGVVVQARRSGRDRLQDCNSRTGGDLALKRESGTVQ
jgi:hypothetical protein